MYLLIILLGAGFFASCGTDHDVEVEGGTKNEAEVRVEYSAETCEDPRFTAEQKLRCIELITNPNVEVTAKTDDELNNLILGD